MKTNNLINTEVAKLSISQRLIWFALKCVSKKTKYKTNSDVIKNLKVNQIKLQRKRRELYNPY